MGKSKTIGDKTYIQDANGEWYEAESPVQQEPLTTKVINGVQYHKDANGDWYEGEVVKKKETTGQPSKTGVQTEESGIPTVSLSPSPSQKTSQPSAQPSQESKSVWEQSSLNPMSTIKGMTQQPAAPIIPEQIQPITQAKPKPKAKPKVVERPSITDNANKIDWYNASEAPVGKVEEPKAILGDFNRAVEEQVQYGKTAEAPKDFTAVDFTKHLFNKMIDATNSMPAAAADMVAASIATQMPNPIQAQQFLHDFRTNIYPSIRDFHKKIELNVPKAKEEEFNNSFLSNVVTGIGEMVPAMALPMGSGFLLQAYDNGINSINQSEEGKNLPEVAKTIFGAASASTLGLLMKLNIDKIFGKDLSKAATSIATKTLNKMLQESEAPITMEAFEKALIPEVTSLKDKIVSNGGKILNSGIHSSLFGTAIAATDDLSKAIVNKATGKKVFDEKSYEIPSDLGKVFDPNSWGNGWKDIATTSASMGAQGLLLGGVAVPRTQESNYIKEAVTNAKSAEDIAKLKNDINEGLGNGTLAPEDAQRVSDLVDKYIAINSKIPAGTPNRSDVVDKVEQKDDLKNQATQIINQTKTVDDAFHPQMLKEAEALMNRANEVNGEITGVSSEPVKQSMYLDPLELPELKQQIADINDRISKGGADGEVAKQELATIKEDPIKFYEDRKQNARENLTPETNLNEVLSGYDSIINKLKENDKENKSRLSGEVGVGEKPIQTQPIKGGGAQEISDNRNIQKEGISGEGEGVEPKVGEEVKFTQEELSNIGIEEPTKTEPSKQEKAGEVTDVEYNNFIDKGAVSNERLNDIAEKIKNKEDLSDREKEIFTDKTADINKILTEKQKVSEPTGEEAGGTVQATTGVPEQQGVKEGVQPSAEPISGGGAETTTTVLKEEAEVPKRNKDNQTEFTTSTGRQKVNRVGDELVVTDTKTGEKVSSKTYKKAVDEYVNNFDFTHGEEGESQSMEPKKATEEIVESSNNPHQLATLYAEQDVPFEIKDMTKDDMIADYGLGGISKESYRRFGDINKLSRKMLSNYIAKKGEASTTIDSMAKSISEHYFPDGDGTEISPNDLVDFMEKYESKKQLMDKKNPLLSLIEDKFQKLTGIKLTREVARKAINQQVEKISQEEQNLLKQDYESAKQLEDNYWRDYKATDGFTKETPTTEAPQAREEVKGAEKPTGAEPGTAAGAEPPVPPTTEPTGETIKPTEPNKIGKFEAKAQKIAESIKKAELPDWLTLSDKEAKKSGLGADDLKQMLADAVVNMGRLLDKGVEFSQALKESVKNLVNVHGEENRDNIEKGFEKYYKDNVGEEASEPITPKTSESKIAPEEDTQMTKMANAINDAYIEGKFGEDALNSILGKLGDTNLKEIYTKVRDKIKNGTINLKDVRERLITTKQGSEYDQAALLYDLAELKGKEDVIQKEIINETNKDRITQLQNQLMDVQNQMMDNALANRNIGRSASTIFRLRQIFVNREADLSSMMQQYKASKGLKDLTPEQEKTVKQAYNTIREAKEKLKNSKEKLDNAIAENERLKAENEKLKELKEKAASYKKQDRSKKVSETIAKSNERIQKSKDALRRLRGDMNVGVNPKVAIEISKIAAEKVYQGVVKFDELVKNVYDDIIEVFPDWTEKDVAAHLLPDFDVNKYYEGKVDLSKSSDIVKEKLAEYKSLQSEYAKKMFEWQKDRRSDIMDRRPFKEKMIDKILRWQRFAVLSYPSTFVKLAAVVGHQLTLKPLKFLMQKGISAISPESVKSKQMIWGDPTASALGKYYSELIRNFSLANLREQFSGIDTKEILHGKGMHYDEWAASNSLLEIPGRSHGYIKSFIKNPEFAYAHEQLTSRYIAKMHEIENKLKESGLSDEKRQELENEYSSYDLTDDANIDKVNKLSLEHAKWSILMEDNKFIEKFRQWTENNGIAGTLIKTELPIVKIPVNFVGRFFAIKYGLIRAITGKGRWETTSKGEVKQGHYPGVVELIKNGTKGLTSEQADLLGKTLSLGTMGASFFLLGYLNRKNIKKNDDGSYEMFGEHISKNLVHSPELESVFSGAETGNSYDEKGEKGSVEWIKSMLESDYDIASKNPFANMLKYGALPNLAGILFKKEGGDKKIDQTADVIGKKISDMAIPGFTKQFAQWTDTGEKGIHPMNEPIQRKPEGSNLERIWQNIEMGLPVLRENVPIKSIPKSDIKEVPELKSLIENKIEIPDVGNRETYTIKADAKHPKGKMTEDEYKKFVSLVKDYSVEKYKKTISSQKRNIRELESMLKKGISNPKDEAEVTELRKHIQNKIKAAHSEAIKKAKHKLNLN